jgi:hypothetical protein
LDGADAKRTKVVGGNKRSHHRKGAAGEKIGCRAVGARRKEEVVPPVIERIREKIRRRDFFLSSHAEDEMAEDGFERTDMEAAILARRLDKRLTHDARGTRYRLEGPADDGRLMEGVCRFRADRSLVIITVYEKR